MFEIEYKGANGIVISAKNSSLVINPKLSDYGLKNIPTKNQIELVTEKKYSLDDSQAKLNINYPGSYEISNFSINGFAERLSSQTKEDVPEGVIYSVETSGVRIGILGNVSRDLSDDQLEKLGVLDILVLPVGGGDTLGASSASMIVRRSDARVIIPVHFANQDINYPTEQSELSLFVKELGFETDKLSKYKVRSASDIPEEPIIIELALAR